MLVARGEQRLPPTLLLEGHLHFSMRSQIAQDFAWALPKTLRHTTRNLEWLFEAYALWTGDGIECVSLSAVVGGLAMAWSADSEA